MELNEENQRAIYVPERFAHGYQALRDNSDTSYQVGEFRDSVEKRQRAAGYVRAAAAGGAGRVEGVRAGAVGEDAAHGGRVLDGGDDAQATARVSLSDVASDVPSVVRRTRLSGIVLRDDRLLGLISRVPAGAEVRVRGTAPSVRVPWAGTRRRHRASQCR